MSRWYVNNSDVGYVDKEWDDYNPSFGRSLEVRTLPTPHFVMLHSQKPPKGEWVLNGDELQKWECDTCGIYLWVEDRDEVECPNCNDGE